MARDGKSTQLRLLVPAALCGAVIGKGGATIRGFAEDSKAAITVSSQDKQPPGVLDRVVRVTGGPEQLLRAVALLLTKLAENPNYARFTSATVSYAAPAAAASPAAAAPAYLANLPAVPTGGAGPKSQQRVEVTVPVPEGRVGAVIGKGGEVRAVLVSVPWVGCVALIICFGQPWCSISAPWVGCVDLKTMLRSPATRSRVATLACCAASLLCLLLLPHVGYSLGAQVAMLFVTPCYCRQPRA